MDRVYASLAPSWIPVYDKLRITVESNTTDGVRSSWRDCALSCTSNVERAILQDVLLSYFFLSQASMFLILADFGTYYPFETVNSREFSAVALFVLR